MRILISWSQVLIPGVAEFLLIRGLFLIFIIALYRTTFYRVLASVCEWVRHMSLNTRVMRSNPASVTAGGVPVSSASSRWDRLRRNG